MLRMKQMAAYSSHVTTKLFSIDTTKEGIEGFLLSFTVNLFRTQPAVSHYLVLFQMDSRCEIREREGAFMTQFYPLSSVSSCDKQS